MKQRDRLAVSAAAHQEVLSRLLKRNQERNVEGSLKGAWNEAT
jgi:hypothetical protein